MGNMGGELNDALQAELQDAFEGVLSKYNDVAIVVTAKASRTVDGDTETAVIGFSRGNVYTTIGLAEATRKAQLESL